MTRAFVYLQGRLRVCCVNCVPRTVSRTARSEHYPLTPALALPGSLARTRVEQVASWSALSPTGAEGVAGHPFEGKPQSRFEDKPLKLQVVLSPKRDCYP